MTRLLHHFGRWWLRALCVPIAGIVACDPGGLPGQDKQNLRPTYDEQSASVVAACAGSVDGITGYLRPVYGWNGGLCTQSCMMQTAKCTSAVCVNRAVGENQSLSAQRADGIPLCAPSGSSHAGVPREWAEVAISSRGVRDGEILLAILPDSGAQAQNPCERPMNSMPARAVAIEVTDPGLTGNGFEYHVHPTLNRNLRDLYVRAGQRQCGSGRSSSFEDTDIRCNDMGSFVVRMSIAEHQGQRACEWELAGVLSRPTVDSAGECPPGVAAPENDAYGEGHTGNLNSGLESPSGVDGSILRRNRVGSGLSPECIGQF